VIIAVHALLYSRDADAARKFFQDTLKLEFVDAGGGWPIFALPPSEFAVHPSHGQAPAKTEDGHAGAALYLICDDLRSTMKTMESKKASFSKVEEAPWGIVTSFALPRGGKVGLYQPKHPTAFKR